MAVKWSWAWGDGAVETPAVMASDMGFAYSSTNAANTTIDSLNTYTYAGSPTRYSLRMDNFMTVDMPGGVVDTKGWVCAPFYVTAATGLQRNRKFVRLWGTGLPGSPEIYLMIPLGGTGITTASPIELWVAGVLQATSANIDWLTTWNYVSLKFDASANPWSASVWVNGVEVISNQTQAETATTTFDLQFMAISGGDREWTIGQVVVYDDPADAGQTPRFCTRIDPTSDLSETGTWTPSTGVDNWAVVDSPFSTSTSTANGTATSGDNFVCTAGDFSTLLGVAPGVVDGVTLHDWSSGSGASVFAAVGESTGPTYTNGSPITPSGASSYAYATAPTNPAGGNWAAADIVVVKHEVS